MTDHLARLCTIDPAWAAERIRWLEREVRLLEAMVAGQLRAQRGARYTDAGLEALAETVAVVTALREDRGIEA